MRKPNYRVSSFHFSTTISSPSMASSRLHSHHTLPAPVIHAGFSVSQSKSHVLAGVQDAYWSDDEAVSTMLF